MYDDIVRMVLSAAARIRQEEANLSKLDSAIGDGDHGSAMARSMDAAAKAIAECDARDAKALLSAIGWAVMGVAGGSTGPLLGSFFTGLGEGAAGRDELDCPAAAAMLESALAGVRRQTQAQIGDKTVIDALAPAVEAVRAAAADDRDIAAALRRAAQAAEKGAESTRDMKARYGRARNLGERAVGHPDPGAVSMACLLAGFADAFGPGT